LKGYLLPNARISFLDPDELASATRGAGLTVVRLSKVHQGGQIQLGSSDQFGDVLRRHL
jgi:hypothetical protein